MSYVEWSGVERRGVGRLGEARDYTQLPHSSYDYTVTSSHEGLPTYCLTFSLATDNLQRTTYYLFAYYLLHLRKQHFLLFAQLLERWLGLGLGLGLGG